MSKKPFTEGSIKELWRVSLPLMLSWLSVVMMTVVDRFFLGKYSTEAMNSCVTASMMVWTFTYGFQTLCEMAEVFVAQANGAGRDKDLGKPVWQMAWISGFSVAFFIPLALFGPYILFGGGEEYLMRRQYFAILALFGPACGLLGCASAYFIGQGRTHIITIVAIIGNLVNLVLDPLFIFTFDWGIEGAAWATGIGFLIQGIILFALFLREHGFINYQIDRPLLMSCLRIGLPSAGLVVIELYGWALYYGMLQATSPIHILVGGISQNFILALLFFGIGLEKGIATIAGNFIGSGKREKIPQLLRSAGILLCWYTLFTTIALCLFPEPLIALFWDGGDPSVLWTLKVSLPIVCAYLFFEHVRWLFCGILIAAGDTFFMMIAGVLCIWAFLLVPIYYTVYLHQASILTAMGFLLLYSVLTAAIFYGRYRQGAWQQMTLEKQAA